jgi:hypothetical protein
MAGNNIATRTLFVIMIALLTASCTTHGAVLRNGRQNKNEQRKLEATLKSEDPKQNDSALRCPNEMPTLHASDVVPEELQNQYTRKFNRMQQDYQNHSAPGTLLLEDPAENMTILPEADFVMWSSPIFGVLKLSAYNEETFVERKKHNGMMFVPPKECDFSKIDNVMEVEGDHAVFLTFFHSVFAHILLDYLPYLSYLKETIPSTTRFLLADSGNVTKQVLEQLDPEFSKRVDWIQCNYSNGRSCDNQMVSVRNGSLTVLHPQSDRGHMDFVMNARRWILERHPPSDESLKQRTCVYYSRNNGSARHGRAMDLEQEARMIQMIEHKLKRFNRPEKFVIFEGGLSIDEQITLFQSANFVIGAHGGGMANLMFLLPSDTCEERPKVLELMTSNLTPLVQTGGMNRNYYNMYTTCPWVEYHNVFYIPPSTSDVTFVDLDDFGDAMNVMLEPHESLSNL